MNDDKRKETLRWLRQRAGQASQQRDLAPSKNNRALIIRQMRAQGMSYKAIAAALDLSHTRVAAIAKQTARQQNADVARL